MRKRLLINKIKLFIFVLIVGVGSIKTYGKEIEDISFEKNVRETRTIWRKDISDILSRDYNDESGNFFKDESGKVLINVPKICQYPKYMTGCELVSSTMVLQFYNEIIDVDTFISEWVELDDTFYWEDGVFYGPNPYEVFVGNPLYESGYGCFSSVIEKAVNQNSSLCVAKSITGKTLEQLCDIYINRGKPLIVWATMGMEKPIESASWHIARWVSFVWPAAEHCLVLVGYDDAFYYFNDPMTGTVVSYEKTIAEERFRELESQAVYISLRK